jgi:hypothetical protein
MAVMGRDNIVVAKKNPPPKPAATITEKPAHGPAVCGAMTQQRDDLRNQSAPQKFVHLVGCHDAKTRASAKP